MSVTNSHVLIVDDEPMVRDLTTRALTSQGHNCDSADNGEDALRLAAANSYDAVVTDLRMPRCHGHTLCTELLKLPEPPCVMVMTALSDPRLVRDLMGRGVYDVVQKPVNYDVLAMKVQSMVEHSRLKRTQATTKPPRKSIAKKINLLQQVETTLIELTEIAGEKLDAVFDSSVELPDPPRSVREFIRRLAESELIDHDKPSSDVVMPRHESRQKERVTCYTTAVAAPVDRQWRRCGEPFKLALRDLSEGGARLLHTRATNAEYLALSWNATQLGSKQIRVVCHIRRCKPCGPFYDLGGQFVLADG